MPLRGRLALREAQTSATMEDWAGVIYPDQGELSLGGALTNALRRFSLPVVALLDSGRGRMIVTTESAQKAALRALVPSVAADCRPVLVWGQTASQWTLVSDAWTYGGAILQTLCLPQLSRRTAGAFLDRALTADPASGFALLDQDNALVRVWSDFNGDVPPVLDAIVASGQTVATQFAPAITLLPFEGGEV